MVKKIYTPERADLVWLDFNPQKGHEQMGKRPAVVISPKIYNEKTGLALFCPVTKVEKGYPFELALPKNLSVEGVVLIDQIMSFDWKARNAEYISTLNEAVYSEIKEKIELLVL